MKETIIIEKDFLKFLLACLANQKFLHEIFDPATREASQKIIDEALKKGMDMVND